MSKYNSNAGFKNYDVSSEETTIESKDSLFAKYKFSLIMGGVAFGVIAIIVILIALFSGNPSPNDSIAPEETVAISTEALDYDELFKIINDEDDSEDITIENPYASRNSNNNNQQTTTKPLIVPSVPPTTAPRSTNNKSTSSSTTNNSSSQSQSNSNSNSGNNQSAQSTQSSQSTKSNSTKSNQSTQQSAKTTTNSSTNKSSTVNVSNVTISKTSVTLTVGSSTTLSASVSPSNATNKTITWASGNNSVATVSGGKIVAVGTGKTTIFATSSNGKKAECSVTVAAKKPVADNVSIDPTDKSININRTLTIKLNGANRCTWKFSNPFVLEQVSVSGTQIKVKGVKRGMSNVEAVLPNGKTYKCKVTVR